MVPQGINFCQIIFLISIEEILQELKKIKNIHIQAFIYDVAITVKNISHLQVAYKKI